MFKLFKKLMPKTAEVITLEDPDFGHISFVESDSDPAVGIWQMHGDWDIPEQSARIGCSSIPGSAIAPYESARSFLLNKKLDLPTVWETVNVRLEEIRCEWRPDTKSQALKQAFRITGLALDQPITDPPSWEVSFEPVDGRWVFINIQLQGDAIIGDTADT